MKEEKLFLNGLTSEVAEKNIIKYGENLLIGKKSVHLFKILLAQFKDIMIIILLFSTAISALMGEYIEAVTIIIIVIINSLIGFFQEYKTEKTLEALKNMASPTCSVIRDGKKIIIDTKYVTVGDLILIEAGNKVCADCIIIKSNYLKADEAVLTGESLSVDKESTDDLNEKNVLHSKTRLYSGTLITNGNGSAIVTDIGMNSQVGKIANMLNEVKEEATPLQKKLDKMGKTIGFGCLAICFLVAIIGIIRGENVFNMLITGISLSVAAIPEGLPAIVTVALALAVGRMVKKQAIIRKLHLVETLGCATVICSDKTGTLTENKMTVKYLFGVDETNESDVAISGSGYEKSGGFFLINNSGQSNNEYDEKMRISPRKYKNLMKIMEIGVLCNNSEIYSNDIKNSDDSNNKKNKFQPTQNISSDLSEKSRNRNQNTEKGSYDIFGDPMEAALLVLASKTSLFKDDLKIGFSDFKEIPFDSSRKMMTVIGSSRAVLSENIGKETVFSKGAVDILIKKCDFYLSENGINDFTKSDKEKFLKKCVAYAGRGLRLLGFAYKTVSPISKDSSPVSKGLKINYETNLIFVGVAAFLDMPRREAFDAVKKCRRAGIKPVMITGDFKETAQAIAKQLHIYNDGDLIMSGSELDEISDEVLKEKITKTTVFARVSPYHKLRIVKAFKQNNEIVAMTGDGVNDAPAVKEADIGVAMGKSGTDVTKEAAAMILLDDNFSTLVSAVEEGRVIFNNIRRFIRYLLSCNIGEVTTMFLSLSFGMPLVLQPIHILLINLVTDSFPAIALGLEPPEKDIMNAKPRRGNASIFSEGLLTKIITRGILIGFTTLISFISTLKITKSLPDAQTAAFYTLVLTQLIHSFECKSERKSLFDIPIFSNFKLIFANMFSFLVVIASIFINPLSIIFKTTPLSLEIILLITGYSFIVPAICAIILKFKK